MASSVPVTMLPPSFLIDYLPLLLAPFIGSFLAMIVDRLPRGEGFGGRSTCRNCHQKIGIFSLVPIVSFLVQRGRCATCNYPIPRSLLGIEIVTLAATLPLLLIPTVAEQITAFLLVSCLIVLAFIDWDHLWLPDAITLPLIMLGLTQAGLSGRDILVDHALGAALGYCVIAGLRALYLWAKGIEAIGLGDAKLLAAAGAWLGWFALPEILLIASLSGLLQQLVLPTKHAGGKIAFGVNIALAFYLLYTMKAVPSTPPSLIGMIQ